MVHRVVLPLVLASATGPACNRVEPAEVDAIAWNAPRFDWPVPTSVWVTQETEKRGQTGTLRFRLTLSAGPNEGERRVRLTDFEFLTLNGRDATTPGMREAVAEALLMVQAVPDMIVDEAGTYLRVEGIDELLERLVAHSADRDGRTRRAGSKSSTG